MAKKTKRVVAVLLVAFLVNALCWSVGTDAFADWVGAEQAVAEQSNVTDKAAASGEHSQKTEKNCNEGCHACCHFQGLTLFEFPVYFPSVPRAVPSLATSLDGVTPSHPRRPPRTPFPA